MFPEESNNTSPTKDRQRNKEGFSPKLITKALSTTCTVRPAQNQQFYGQLLMKSVCMSVIFVGAVLINKPD